MAYVIWRVVMKRYSRIRLGLHGGAVGSTVICKKVPPKPESRFKAVGFGDADVNI
jgi:hypothetical protein